MAAHGRDGLGVAVEEFNAVAIVAVAGGGRFNASSLRMCCETPDCVAFSRLAAAVNERSS
jgi:hypothetical protein